MEKEVREKLLQSVKRDDAATFGEIASPEVFSAVFGRFPLLSLLYLFNAKRILRRHLPELVKERPRLKVEPFLAADELFRKRAGKCLRYYVTGEVSALEMLAILGRGKELKRIYPFYPNASRILPMIHKIYFTRLGEGVSATGDKLNLPNEPLSFRDNRMLARFSMAFLAAFVLIAVVTSVVFGYYGVGSKKSYYRVTNAGTALSAMEANQYISLKKDVALSGSVEEYSATLDGNDNVIKLSAPFIEKLTGEICNVIFVLQEDFSGDAVILENQGTLKNVRVVAEGVSLNKNSEHMGLLTAVNGGVIQNCNAVMEVSITGDGGGDCFFAPIAGSNEGTINNCSSDGKITAVNTDIGGIAGKNAAAGTITDCVVKAEFSQTANIKGWTPNVAGVSAQNEGTIYGCTVEGSITSDLCASALDEEESPASAYAGGIACVNAGTVKACRNKATVYAYAENGYAFAAGVATVNFKGGVVRETLSAGSVKAESSTHNACAGGISAENNQSSILSCGQTSSVEAVSPSDRAYGFAGGIVGYNNGEVVKCFFTGTLSAYDMTRYSGAICGVLYLPYTLQVVMEQNAFTAEGHVSGAVISEWMYYDLRPGYIYGLAFLESNEAYAPYIEGILDYGGEKVTEEELKAKEIYYE